MFGKNLLRILLKIGSMLCLERRCRQSSKTTLKMGERGYIYHIHDFLPKLSARIVVSIVQVLRFFYGFGHSADTTASLIYVSITL